MRVVGIVLWAGGYSFVLLIVFLLFCPLGGTLLYPPCIPLGLPWVLLLLNIFYFYSSKKKKKSLE